MDRLKATIYNHCVSIYKDLQSSMDRLKAAYRAVNTHINKLIYNPVWID